MLKRLIMSVVLALLTGTASAEEATAYIVSPADGATVKNPVTVVFGLRMAAVQWRITLPTFVAR